MAVHETFRQGIRCESVRTMKPRAGNLPNGPKSGYGGASAFCIYLNTAHVVVRHGGYRQQIGGGIQSDRLTQLPNGLKLCG